MEPGVVGLDGDALDPREGQEVAVAAADPEGSLAMTTQLLASLVGILVGLAGGVMFILSRQAVRTDGADAENKRNG